MPPSRLPPDSTTEQIVVHRLVSHTATPYAEVIQHFRHLVPQINLIDYRAQTSAEGIERVIRNTGTTNNFVLFAEFNHGHWIKHFPTTPIPSSSLQSTSLDDVVHGGRGLHRFVFGNPLFAITMIREDVEAALHVPMDCCLIEQEDGSTRTVTLLPSGLIAAHETGRSNEALKRAAGEVERKLLDLIEEVLN